MKTSKPKTDFQKLAAFIETARLRVAAAETRWKTAKEQARMAKRRRKEVKLIARRARKQAKQAKADLAEARKALAEAEAKLDKSGVRTSARKPARAKTRPVAKQAVAAPKKKAAPAQRRASPTPKPVTQKPAMPVAAKVPHLKPAAKAAGQPIAVPRDMASLEAPTAPASSEPHI